VPDFNDDVVIAPSDQDPIITEESEAKSILVNRTAVLTVTSTCSVETLIQLQPGA
jgi:hypothetical protein